MQSNKIPHSPRHESVKSGDVYIVDADSSSDFVIKASDGSQIECSSIVSATETTVGNDPVIHCLILLLKDGNTVSCPAVKYDPEVRLASLRSELEESVENKTFVGDMYSLQHYFPYLIYPYHVWYDILSETYYSDITGEKSQLVDAHLVYIAAHIQSRYRDINLASKNKFAIKWAYSVIEPVVMSEAYRNKVNPFRDWLETTKWDGVSRIDTMFQTFLGATNDPKYLAAVAEAWLVGAVHRQYEPIRHEVIVSTIGPQGVGKTSFFEKLGMGYTVSTQVDMDHPAQFLENVRGCIIAELGEGKSVRKDIRATKEFLSRAFDRIRKPWHHNEEDYPRHFIIALTSNTTEFLNDQTGARRFYPVTCTDQRKFDPRPASTPEETEYIQQIWAEAYYLYVNNLATSVVPDSVKDTASEEQNSIIEFDDEVSEVECWLDDPANNATHIGSKLSYRQIVEGALHVMPGEKVSNEVNKTYKRWRNSTKCWKRIPHAIRMGDNNVVCNGVMERVRLPELPKSEQSNSVTITDSSEHIKRYSVTA